MRNLADLEKFRNRPLERGGISRYLILACDYTPKQAHRIVAQAIKRGHLVRESGSRKYRLVWQPGGLTVRTVRRQAKIHADTTTEAILAFLADGIKVEVVGEDGTTTTHLVRPSTIVIDPS